MGLFDTHVHLDFNQYEGRIAEILGNARKNGVTRFLNVASSLEGSLRSVKIAIENKGVFASVGIHPSNVNEASEKAMLELFALSNNSKVVAIGETGLDFFVRGGEEINKKNQINFFKKHLLLAKEQNLPVIIHCRQAFDEVFKILSKYKNNKKGVFHCFSGGFQEAQEVLDLGFKISFTANITYKNQEMLLNAIKKIPPEQILIETDSPFLPPQSKRGEINEPTNVTEVVKKISEIKNKEIEEVVKITTKNALELFEIEEK